MSLRNKLCVFMYILCVFVKTFSHLQRPFPFTPVLHMHVGGGGRGGSVCASDVTCWILIRGQDLPF